jgi:hypothetical protein
MHSTLVLIPRAALAPVLAVLLSGCFSEHTTLPTGEDVSFATDIQPILNGSCASSACHGTGSANPPSKPMLLSTGEAYDAIVGVASAQLPSMARVTPGQPDQSYLIRKLQGTHRDVGGLGSRMPLGQPPLAQSVVDVIRRWVSEGAARN